MFNVEGCSVPAPWPHHSPWGSRPNDDSVSVAMCERALERAGLPPNIVIDCSSPDGRSLALEIGGANHGLWVYDIGRTTMTRLALGFDNVSPVWTPDGKRIAFASNRFGPMNLLWKPADGSGPAERLTTSEHPQRPGTWSPDGATLLFEEYRPETGWDLWSLSANGGDAPRPFVQTASMERRPAFSADGRWVAYESDETGPVEIHVRSFPGSDVKRRVSTGGGRFPVWSANGHELLYRQDDRILKVDIDAAEDPSMVFETGSARRGFDLMPDGEQVVTVDAPEAARDPTQLTLVLNWSVEIAALVTP